ncbi:predicted protein [Plenodomus lingam JN3]|uniref:Predicted protein n=1 Tax=Leptosphaeria maculans (strain JN3 / isolate v23.1.3 / race Av1-4-5-6-7-8) TaxID=985895 RepID=E4ZWJ9_LEPMJ|nr:predicted protein [Plenodomus lingam JN3]CBX95975.1 predicted protein [Plenodomus lingam JN3]
MYCACTVHMYNSPYSDDDHRPTLLHLNGRPLLQACRCACPWIENSSDNTIQYNTTQFGAFLLLWQTGPTAKPGLSPRLPNMRMQPRPRIQYPSTPVAVSPTSVARPTLSCFPSALLLPARVSIPSLSKAYANSAALVAGPTARDHPPRPYFVIGSCVNGIVFPPCPTLASARSCPCFDLAAVVKHDTTDLTVQLQPLRHAVPAQHDRSALPVFTRFQSSRPSFSYLAIKRSPALFVVPSKPHITLLVFLFIQSLVMGKVGCR